MISIKNQVPSIYYAASRDFQVLGHLYEVVLNYNKTNADLLYLLPNNIDVDPRLTELLATTLGFKLRRNYDKAQLAALVSIFPRLLKVKGTLTAVELAGNALVKAAGVSGTFESQLDVQNHVLTIKIPIELSDITLFTDLLPYILPFGIRVSIVRITVLKREVTTAVGTAVSMRKALPTIHSESEHWQQHPLGLAKTSSITVEDSNGNEVDKLYVDYSESSLIGNDNKAIAGLFGASPIIAFDELTEGKKAASAPVAPINDEEEN